ncbi:MAG: type IV toxin-antitoxin system AbiEi family antitoxin domain-containing protein [bacterium]|nr:type IV toxin-antitoxin system AbiEi family antitoxin domain-containing protein [bacterium]
MQQRTRLNVASRLRHLTEAQNGYFTRAQAHDAGVADFELERAVDYDQAVRLDTGVYRLVGAPVDLHEQLRVAWLRLTPAASPLDRIHRPTVWVAHHSAAIVHGYGDFIADRPEFIATRRIQPRFDVKIAVRRHGLDRTDWVVRAGFAVTSPVRTFGDLVARHSDGGHLGRYAHDAMAAGAATADELQAVAGRLELRALLAMAEK